VTRGGRDYATPAAWARLTPGTSADQVRRAASLGSLGPEGETVTLSPNGKIKAYPIDVLAAWEAARAGDSDPGGRPSGDLSAVAAKLGVSKMRVWRAVNAGLIDGTKDRFGVWQLEPESVERWQASGMPAPRAQHHK
jgi:hypothetical protein